MATARRTVRLRAETYSRLAHDAARHNEQVDDAADRILRDNLQAPGEGTGVLAALKDLEALRARMKPGKGALCLVQEGRDELADRVA
jgi:hypothetical protein